MIADANKGLAFDGVTGWQGGMDGGKRGNLIGADQYQEGENVTCRGGNLRTRPVWKKLPLTFENELFYDVAGGHGGNDPLIDTQSAFNEHLFQGALYYDPPNDEAMIVASIGGRMFKLVPRRTSFQVTELNLDKQNRRNIRAAYMVQADRFLLIQDGESSCIIYDGVSARRATQKEIPVGTMMAYGMGRVVLVGKNQKDIAFGDLYGSHEGEPGDSVLQFTETTYLSEGGAASVPFSMGHIKGLFFYPQQDTTMGQGELIVAAEKGMASFFLSLPREQWKNSTFQRMALLDIGGRGHRAFTPINGDVWFRAGDGWRMYRQARAESRGYAQLPMSTEVGKYVDKETEALLYLASSIRFNNRLITTSTPIPNQGRPYHNGLLSLDFDVLSSFGQAKLPSWDGHWSGVKVTQLVEGLFDGVHRAFAFGLEDEQNVIYELVENETEDSVGPVTSYVIPRTFNFNSPFNETDLLDQELWVEGVKANTTPTIYFKPDRYPTWVPWNSAVSMSVINPIDGADSIAGIPTRNDGFKPRLASSTPLAGADTFSTNRELKRFYELDLRIEWEGYMEIKQLRIQGRTQVEQATSTR